MLILSSIGRIAAQDSTARARYRSERTLLSLPPELRKDIGWPEILDQHDGRRFVRTERK